MDNMISKYNISQFFKKQIISIQSYKKALLEDWFKSDIVIYEKFKRKRVKPDTVT